MSPRPFASARCSPRRRRAARHAVWLVALVLTAAVGSGAGRLTFDNSYETWFLDDDPALVAYREFQDRFGSDETLVLVLDAGGDPYSAETWAIVQALSEYAEGHPEVLAVHSLARARIPRAGPRGIPGEAPLLGANPSPAERESARRWVQASALYRVLVGGTGAHAALILRLRPTGASFEAKSRLVADLRRAADRLSRGRRTWLAGSAVVDDAVYRMSQVDSARFVPALLLLLFLVLLATYRNPVLAAVPLVVVGGTLAWTLGLMGWFGGRATVLTAVLPPLLLAVALADAVHLVHGFRAERGRCGHGRALRRAVRHALRPCLLTTLTTAGGMAALVVAPLPAVRGLGLAAAVGVLIAFGLTFAVAAPVLALVPEPWLGRPVRADAPFAPGRLAAAAGAATRRRGWVLGFALLLLLASVPGILRLRVGASMESYFYPTDPVYQDMEVVDRALGGAFPFQVLVEARAGVSLLSPEVLGRVGRLARLLEDHPATGTAISYLDFLVAAREWLAPGGEKAGALPASAAQAGVLARGLAHHADFRAYLTPDGGAARIEVLVRGTRYQELVADLEALEARARGIAGPDLRLRVTGLGRLLAQMEAYLLTSQARAFALAFAVVLLLIVVFFRSIRLGGLALLPNLLPIALVLGAAGWLALRLDATTIMVAPVLMGLVVDGTVHLYAAMVRRERRRRRWSRNCWPEGFTSTFTPPRTPRAKSAASSSAAFRSIFSRL